MSISVLVVIIAAVQVSCSQSNKPCSREGSRIVRDYFTRVSTSQSKLDGSTDHSLQIRRSDRSMRSTSSPFHWSAFSRPCAISTIDKSCTKRRSPMTNGCVNTATKHSTRKSTSTCISSIDITPLLSWYAERVPRKESAMSHSRTNGRRVYRITARYFAVTFSNDRSDR